MLFSPELFQLAALLGEALGGPVAPDVVVNRRLCALAQRHQVGALLYPVAARNHRAVAAADLEILRQCYDASASRRQASLAVLEQVAERFAERQISWAAVKGTTQAALLYPDPAWRESADIDLLVQPAQFAAALDVLVEMGFVASYPPVPSHGLLRKLLMAAVRDIMLVARADSRDSIELHQRLFFAGDRHVADFDLPVLPGRIPTPVPGPELAFYLIAHGALSYWVRLKWLVDLVPLLARLDAQEALAVREQARRSGTENSVVASLALLQALFPFAVPKTLRHWLDEKMLLQPVQYRFHRYAELLGREDDQHHSPLNDALIMLQATFLLFEAPSARMRILAAAPLSSALRRVACRLYRADRALTLS